MKRNDGMIRCVGGNGFILRCATLLLTAAMNKESRTQQDLVPDQNSTVRCIKAHQLGQQQHILGGPITNNFHNSYNYSTVPTEA